MGNSKLVCLTGLALVLAACGGETKPEATAEKAPERLAAGLYEMSAEVIQLASTDQTTPATKLKQGDKLVTRACVGTDGVPEPSLFAEEGDDCQIKNSYVRNGRMSVEMSCKREGMSGDVMPAMRGSFTKDGFEGEITTLTYFIKDGDYRLTREISARLLGDCPAEGTTEGAPETAG
jgi:hypothetical protein